jgi:arabinofuranan 3-O-arabinosyltransferase
VTTSTLASPDVQAADPPPSRVVDRARAAVICLCLVAVVFSQQPGLIVGDTKLDLVVDPARFLARSLHLWDPTAAFGLVQDQSYGYLFPMGPFFALGHVIGLPAWVIQRLWQSGLLIAAFLGLRALAARMGIGTPVTRLIGGVAYALSPLIVSKLGPISSEALAECVAPWVLLPLVGQSALLRPRRSAALSGVALLFAGGINAAATLAILPLPGLWLLTRAAGRQRRRLIGWWVLSIVLASMWWALPLVEFGRYSPPFIDWIESASVTVSPTNLLSVLSGTEDWVGHLTSAEGPLWRAAWDLETSGIAVLDAAVLAGLGLVGLLRRDLPERRFLIGSTLLGVVLITLGHGPPVAAAFAGNERHLLDGTAAAFRNVHKFDLVLRVPLTLALIHLASIVTGRLEGTLRTRLNLPGRILPVALVACVAVLGIGLPLWQQDLEPAGAYAAIPSWWPQTASYLAAHDDGTHALLLPAATHGNYGWGAPEDEPLEALATTPWVSRDAVALGGAGERQLLDGVDAAVDSGQGSAALTAYLARAGVGWIVLRTDLDPVRAGNASPIVVRAALQSSPGISQVASFGGTLDPLTGPTIQVYRVFGASTTVTTAPLAGTVRLSGNASDLYQALSDDLVSPDTPVVTAATPTVSGEQPQTQRRVVTDGNRHTETEFPSVQTPESATLLPGQPWAIPRKVHEVGLADSPGHQTTAVLYGVASVSASSSAADAGAYWFQNPDDGPVAAFDGDPSTTWVSGRSRAVGQWVQENYVYPVQASTITLWAPAISGVHSVVTGVRVTTSSGSETLAISTAPQSYPLPPGPTSSVRITVTDVAGGGAGTTATLEADVAGAPVASEGLAVPADGSTLTGGTPAQSAAAFSFAGNPQSQGCVWLSAPRRSVCQPSLVSSSEGAQGLDRSFSLDRTATYSLVMKGRALGGPALDSELPQPTGIVMSVSSQLVSDPADGQEALVDGDPATSWIAGASDRSPHVDVFSTHRRTVRTIQLALSPSADVSPPATVLVQADGRSEQAVVPDTGLVRLAHGLTGKAFAISFPKVALRVEPGTTVGAPVGLSGLRLGFADGSRSGTVAATAPFHESCGKGPTLSVRGITTPTSVSGTVAQIMTDRDLAIQPCPGSAGTHLLLGAGAQRIRLATTSTVTPDSMSLTPTGADAAPGTDTSTTATRTTQVTSWHPDSGTVTVGGGTASWLMVSQNANAGWRATLDGHPLPSTVLDGWRQAFLLPAGAGGRVRIWYAPDRAFRAGLVAGAVDVLLLIGLVLLRTTAPLPVSESRIGSRRGRRIGSGVLVVAALVAVPAIAGLPGLVVLAGVLAVRLVVARLRPARVDAAAAALVIAGLTVAAIVAARHPYASGGAWGAAGTTAQLGCALALGAVAVSLVPRRRPPVAEQQAGTNQTVS